MSGLGKKDFFTYYFNMVTMLIPLIFIVIGIQINPIWNPLTLNINFGQANFSSIKEFDMVHPVTIKLIYLW
jgi:hypothetical protein